MRFKKYILLSLVLCGFAACSDDNEIEIPKAPVLEKAQLALAIKSEYLSFPESHLSSHIHIS